MGRADYNEAINRTEDEQMLLSIVKGRYGETFSLLAVTGVAAQPGEFVQAILQGSFSGAGTLGDPLLGLFDSDCNLIDVNDDAIGVDVEGPFKPEHYRY